MALIHDCKFAALKRILDNKDTCVMGSMKGGTRTSPESDIIRTCILIHKNQTASADSFRGKKKKRVRANCDSSSNFLFHFTRYVVASFIARTGAFP